MASLPHVRLQPSVLLNYAHDASHAMNATVATHYRCIQLLLEPLDESRLLYVDFILFCACSCEHGASACVVDVACT